MPNDFVLWSTSHLLTIAVIGVASLMIPWSASGLAPAQRRRFEVGFALFMVCHEVVRLTARVVVYGEAWQENLPLQLCGISVFLLAAFLIRPHLRIYELLYFWGLGGAVQAVVTPDLPVAFPHPLNIGYFVYHGAVIIGAVYGTFVLGFRPRANSLPRVFVTTLVYAFGCVAPLNMVLGTNYLYLRHKPDGASMIDHLGPWPWYLVSLAGVAWVSFVVYYAPFWFADRRRAHRRRSASPPPATPDGSPRHEAVEP